MRAELIYAGDEVRVPSTWKPPRHDQLKGTPAEVLVELCGRGCYDSLGSGRNSHDYHQHLLEVKHYSVHEHVHFTLSFHKCLSPELWIGVPDVTFEPATGMMNYHRITVNFRHVLEFPNQLNPIYVTHRKDQVEAWRSVLWHGAHQLAPNLFPATELREVNWTEARLVSPINEREHFVSLFLEDSRVWSHEMVRHRFNMSQRSGRYCDETEREYALHPYLRQYFDECGYIALHPEDGGNLWCEADPTLPSYEVIQRTNLGCLVGSHIAQSRMLYDTITNKLQDWLMARKGLDKGAARKQARSAARYYLGNGLSTEMIFTASIASWRDIFLKRINPAADQAISQLMTDARDLINSENVVRLQPYRQDAHQSL